MEIFDIALALTPRIGGRGAKQLLEVFGSARRIFEASEMELRADKNLSPRVIADIISRKSMGEAEREMEFCRRNNIEIIAIGDPLYPTPLAQIYDPPHIIYCQGDTSILNRSLISIVGTRRSTPYGERATKGIVKDIYNNADNIVIVSGLAHGIDAAAHRAAIDLDIPSVAVLPSPLPNISPRAHASLARSIIEAGGVVLSELHTSTRDIGKGYIPRNRIIAGISAATLVIESPSKGGSLHTARMAAEMGRIVGAVPGRITDEQSKGCNQLIAQEVARPILSGMDLISQLGWEQRHATEEATPHTTEEQSQTWELLTPPQRGLLLCFRFDEPLHISELEELSQLPTSQINGMLLELELLGAVEALPGARYERTIPLIHKGEE